MSKDKTKQLSTKKGEISSKLVVDKTIKERVEELKKLIVEWVKQTANQGDYMTLDHILEQALKQVEKQTEERVIGKQADDMRKGQTVFNFLVWLKEEKGVDGKNKMADPFYITDDNWDKLFKEYTKVINKLKKK